MCAAVGAATAHAVFKGNISAFHNDSRISAVCYGDLLAIEVKGEFAVGYSKPVAHFGRAIIKERNGGIGSAASRRDSLFKSCIVGYGGAFCKACICSFATGTNTRGVKVMRLARKELVAAVVGCIVACICHVAVCKGCVRMCANVTTVIANTVCKGLCAKGSIVINSGILYVSVIIHRI